eukprot:symbB.v1.2.037318.t1/scaffold5479.1/size26705/1
MRPGDFVELSTVIRNWWAFPAVGFNSILELPVHKFEVLHADEDQPLGTVVVPNSIFGLPIRKDILFKVYWFHRRKLQGYLDTMTFYKWEWPGSNKKARSQKKSGKGRMGRRKAPGRWEGTHCHALRPRDWGKTKVNVRVIWQAVTGAPLCAKGALIGLRRCLGGKGKNNKGDSKGKGKGKNVNSVEQQHSTEPEAEASFLEIAMLEQATSSDETVPGEEPTPDVGLPEETRREARRRYRRLLRQGAALTWRDLPVTRYRQRLAAAAEMQQQFRGTVGLSMARRVLAREGLDQACSSCDDRHGPSYDAAAKFAATRATSSRVPGAYDTPDEDTEETMESESQRTHEAVEIECSESEAPEHEEEHVELEDRSNEADDEDENVEEVMNAYMEEVAEFQTEDERKGIREALNEAKRFLEIEKTTHEIELQEALEKETEQVAGD